MDFLWILMPAVVVVLGLVVIGFTFTRLYKRATRETSLVRTGAGGLKVIIDGGAIVIPGLHDLLKVNMKTMVVDVDGGEGLITRDSRRVDAKAQFFIRVGAEPDAIGKAAQSLGSDTNDINVIRGLIEGKVQDTMRAITAKMDLNDLQSKRGEFVQDVQKVLKEELEPNGLELESVALTRLDETDISKLDANNTFDVTGMRARAAIVTEQNKQRVAIEEAGELEIARTRQRNRIEKLEVDREEAKATNEQRTAVAQMQSDADIREAQILASTEREREVARITRETKVAEAEIERKQAVDIANQQSAAKVAEQSEVQSKAEAKAAEARATAVAADESVQTARATAVANREKAIEIIDAEREAEKSATSIRVKARVEREAAEDQAAAVIAAAEAEAKSINILAEAAKAKGLAEAEARRALVDAENGMSEEVMAFKLKIATIEALPKIIAEMVEPARHIGHFNINQISGLGGLMGAASGDAVSAGNGDVVGQVFHGMRQNAVLGPVLAKLGSDIGVDVSKGLDGFAEILGASPAAAEDAETVDEAPAGAATETQH